MNNLLNTNTKESFEMKLFDFFMEHHKTGNAKAKISLIEKNLLDFVIENEKLFCLQQIRYHNT